MAWKAQNTTATMPAQVGGALTLLWATLLLNILDSSLNFGETESAGPDFQFALALILAGIFSINALLIYFASRRRNWARIALLLFTILGLSTYLFFPTDLAAYPWWSGMLTAITTLFEIVALTLLFFGSGAKWYSSQPSA